MNTRLHKTDSAAILGVITLAAIFITLGLAAPKNAFIPVTGAAPEVNPALYVGPDFAAWDIRLREQYQITESYVFVPLDYAVMDPHARERFQITEPYDEVPLAGEALPANSTFIGGPDYSAWDIRLREQLQITEEYPYTATDYATMDPQERQRLQITEDYPEWFK